MKQKRFTARWQTYYFKLEDGFLTHYEKKSLVGTRKHKVRQDKKKGPNWWVGDRTDMRAGAYIPG